MPTLAKSPFHLRGVCPLCEKTLTVRHSQKNDEFFLGCTGYPRCRHTESYDEALNDCLDWFAASIDTDLKQLIVLSHPDKWPNNALAHEVTLRLNALREKVAGMFEGERR